MILVIFLRFLNFGPFFGLFLGTLGEKSKHKKVAPGNSLNATTLMPLYAHFFLLQELVLILF